MRRLGAGFTLLMSLLLVTALLTAAEAAGSGRQRLATGSSPRLVRLQHSVYQGRIVAAVNSWDARGPYAPIFESTDEGRSFHRIGEVRDPEGARGECCGSLYELPRRVGNLRAGTLLWAASYGQGGGSQRRVAIRIWASRDGGRHWSFLSEPFRSPNGGGLWEPELSVDAAGTLWVHYADESESPRFSQLLARTGSDDGLVWSAPRHTLALQPERARPGMPLVRALPDGRFYFAYEICNYGDQFCDPYYKISPDGADFGDPADPGRRAGTPGGNYFQHAQTVTLFPGGAHGTRLVMVGQIYTDHHGTPLPSNGRVLLVNDEFGAGAWSELPAPVPVPDAYDNFCPNYSSALLPVDGGGTVLEIAADYDHGVCTTYFARGPLS
ncbi:sialidase family protein [Amycolatopsis cynarae]|uniref:Sialidase family protein n=1 Tax=Amycolatopsis cynarae TaxID=2995223 RepID=A0ABY7BAM3_9PSEU|nr:sialidase family protein [Amycolatopsis sp. HUAS 11-8]WAL69027.1 sialidase family protein [Amycolatopsis sp. HUAS 11-8]